MSNERSGARICFVSMDNLNRVPYIQTYIKWINQPFDVVYWDRSGVNESVGEACAYRFEKHIKTSGDGGQKLQKLIGYWGFRSFAKKILLANNYELVFALTGNCAVLISDLLLSKYRRRYIIDIRDYWHEDFVPYHRREQRLIKESAQAVISSPAYAEFLCEYDYAVMHNDQILDPGIVREFREKSDCSDPFVISCVGAMKNLEYDKKVIDYFANDDRFLLKFVSTLR